MRKYIDWEKSTHFVFPIDGDVLNEFDGEVRDGKLYVNVKVESDSPVKVNGQKAVKCGDYYTSEVCINDGKTVIVAEGENAVDEISVFTLKKHTGYYRLSSDDNIIFLYDINKNKDKYNSIFDNPYLAVYKKAHDLYGAAVHLNIYYEMPEEHILFTEKREYFNLSMMTDKFKEEWQANSDWLKLNFHAKADQPSRPYKNTDYDTIYKDCKQVQEEIIRFAGKETLSNETTVHWGECTYEGVKAIRDLGIRSLAGYFVIENGKTVVSYFYPKYLTDYLSQRDFWYDTELDVFYCKIDRVLNLYNAKECIELLNYMYTQKTRSGFIELMMHEEYFYPDCTLYESDFEERILEPCRWVYEKGYKGIFIEEAR
ncbi:MAG: hypothetical protein E7574_03790 [Ruminococcaceae bacterium]|nr:hypothetical protein [Oscillospiraceae bacterium]